MGARSRYVAQRHLDRMAETAVGRLPPLACVAFDAITTSLVIDGRFELEELTALETHVFPRLAAREVCLDIGANIGNHAVFFADHFRRVLAFEPHPRIFRLLELNAELRDNIEVFQVGLSDRAGRVSAAPLPGNVGTTSIRRADQGGDGGAAQVAFDVVRLDDIDEVRALERVDFVKIDVEGHEVEALEGARETLMRHRPVVALEVLGEDIADGSSAAIELLKSFGYAHVHALQSNRPFARAPKPVARLATALMGLLLDRRPPKRFTVEPVERLERRNYPIVLVSVAPLV